MPSSRSPVINFWFIFNAIVALAPPIYWAASSAPPMLGFPATLVYFLAVNVSLTASIVAAYLSDSRRGALE